MSVLIDHRYALLLSSRLPQFKIKKNSPLLINSRCVICGDSAKKARKARFYIYVSNGAFITKCHNCGYSQPLGKFIKTIDPELYREYLFEIFAEKREEVKLEEINTNPIISSNNILKGLFKISSLSPEHRAKKYVQSRKIPSDTHYRLFYTPHFAKWVNSKKPDSLYDKMKIDPRLVLPLLDREGNCFGVQGRDLTGKSELRYITIRFNDNFPKVYGLEKFNPNYKGYILEGPIDSLFLPNALAMAGADISMSDIVNVSNANPERLVYVFDNERRNKEMLKRIEKTIDAGYNVCIWPSSITQKDVNEMIQAGIDVKSIIDSNTYSGLEAQLQLTTWRKD